MSQEYTTHERTGKDGVLHLALDLDTRFPDMDVDVRVSVEPKAKPDERPFDEALKKFVGACGFEPDDLSRREALARDYERIQRACDKAKQGNVSLAETLRGKTGIVEGASPDLSQKTGEKFASFMVEKHKR